MNRSKFIRLALATSVVPTLAVAAADETERLPKPKDNKTTKTNDKKKKWIQLFNGKDLSGWTPKIRYEKLGEDKPVKRFLVADGFIKVNYENYENYENEP